MLAPVGIFAAPDKFEHAQRVAKVFAESALVPSHFQNKLANCLIALNIADRMGEDPLTVMQNLAIVSGKPCWQTQYMIARANKSGVFSSRITWRAEGQGGDLAVTASAALADSGEVVSVAVSMAMAKADGWLKNAKYQSMPEHMLRWRSAAMLIRLYAPEVMLGIQSTEEVEDATQSAPRDVTPPRQVVSSAQPAGPRPSGPPRLAASKPAPEAEKPAPVETQQPDPAVEDDAEAVVTQFENDVQLARTEEDIADCEAVVTPYAESDRLCRAQRQRIENAAEAARERIKASTDLEQDEAEPDVDPNDADFKKGAEAARAGQKRCVIQAIREDETRFAKWKAGFDSVEAEG
ncbi:hypothetical protein KEC54_13915 [Methylorubrum extorquens]|uniref:RecT protein n=1 Tax=Methylorubrum extorquens TaxID=408 RepID=A0AAX3WPV5_METEX|nr:hypothetical protein KEC54_13915 [Methylorubrum extorquens]